MSRSQLARTPANFPRMKHRAAGRLARKQAMEALPGYIEILTEALNRAMAGPVAMGKAIASVFANPPVQSDFALAPEPAVFKDGLIPHPTIEGLRYDPTVIHIPTGDPAVDGAYRLARATETYSFPQYHRLEGRP